MEQEKDIIHDEIAAMFDGLQGFGVDTFSNHPIGNECPRCEGHLYKEIFKSMVGAKQSHTKYSCSNCDYVFGVKHPAPKNIEDEKSGEPIRGVNLYRI